MFREILKLLFRSHMKNIFFPFIFSFQKFNEYITPCMVHAPKTWKKIVTIKGIAVKIETFESEVLEWGSYNSLVQQDRWQFFSPGWVFNKEGVENLVTLSL